MQRLACTESTLICPCSCLKSTDSITPSNLNKKEYKTNIAGENVLDFRYNLEFWNNDTIFLWLPPLRILIDDSLYAKIGHRKISSKSAKVPKTRNFCLSFVLGDSEQCQCFLLWLRWHVANLRKICLIDTGELASGKKRCSANNHELGCVLFKLVGS